MFDCPSVCLALSAQVQIQPINSQIELVCHLYREQTGYRVLI